MPYLRWIIIGALLAVGCFTPLIGDRWLRGIEGLGARLARRKVWTLVAVALLAIVSRLALFLVMPLPEPATHDEFSYLLAADTFVHGRLANPPHPMWIFFDTFHVLQHPTYASMYPPAQGGVLALGQLLGHPWIGVLFSMALMCASITWMLQGWFPPQWALLGGALALLRIHLFSYWLESYWGGAVPAIGGALVIGAFPRIVKRQRPRDAVLMGIGAGLLANSRPFEGLLFCIPVGIALILWLLSDRSPAFRCTGLRVLLPLLCVSMLTLAFIGYYNRRVTGDAFLLPHVLDDRLHETLPPFVWQSYSPRVYANAQFDVFYNVWVVGKYHQPFVRLCWNKFRDWWGFFLGSFLAIPLVTLPWVLRDRRTRLPLVLFVWCGLGLLAVVYFEAALRSSHGRSILHIVGPGDTPSAPLGSSRSARWNFPDPPCRSPGNRPGGHACCRNVPTSTPGLERLPSQNREATRDHPGQAIGDCPICAGSLCPPRVGLQWR